MLTDDADRQFKPADFAELVAVVVVLGVLFWLLDPLNPWLKYPAVIVGSVLVLLGWAAIKKAMNRRRGVVSIEPLQLVAGAEGRHSLILSAGGTPSDDAVFELGHEPNGYFWQGVAERLMPSGESEVIAFDSEAGMFCAHSDDAESLAVLGRAMAPVVNDPVRLRAVVAAAEADGFEFDD